MNMKRAITSLASGIFLLCMVSQAQAVPVPFSFNFGLSDGGTASGSITLDTMAPAFPNVLVDFNFTTSGGALLPDGTYDATSTVTVNSNFGAIINEVGGNSLTLIYNPGLILNGPGPMSVSFVESRPGIDFPRLGGGAASSAVPEPSAILLFGSGLLGLGLWRYRKNLKS